MPRFFCPAPLHTGELLELPAGAARHVQVLRLQPGDNITLFNFGPGWTVGSGTSSPGGEFAATVTQMGRSHVQVHVGAHQAVEREPHRAVHLALAMPANDRMDWLVEKATELGVASIQPLLSERSVLRLTGERADKKTAHWQSVAVSACEQCGGNRVPLVHPVATLAQWLRALPSGDSESADQHHAARLLLSLRDGSRPLRDVLKAEAAPPAVFLSGPEGGLSSAEEDAALACGFTPVSLGARVLRAETAALTALARLI
jgi:16S rRNA (uracil1498-N3)-methyltransferase